jgi:hypothetical protein
LDLLPTLALVLLLLLLLLLLAATGTRKEAYKQTAIANQ